MRPQAAAEELDLGVAPEDQAILEDLVKVVMTNLKIMMAGVMVVKAEQINADGRTSRLGEDLPQEAVDTAEVAVEDPRQDPLVPQSLEAGGVGEEEETPTRTMCCGSASRS